MKYVKGTINMTLWAMESCKLKPGMSVFYWPDITSFNETVQGQVKREAETIQAQKILKFALLLM